MKVYETLKNLASNARKIAAITFVAALPYICEDCGYSGNKVNATEIKCETNIVGRDSLTETLETMIAE